MNVGMMFQANPSLSSLKYVAGSLVRAVSAGTSWSFFPASTHTWPRSGRGRWWRKDENGFGRVLIPNPEKQCDARLAARTPWLVRSAVDPLFIDEAGPFS